MTERARRRDIVLVVDDAPDTLRFLTDTLEGAGVTVLIATDGESCLALVDEVTPHLILMDAMMPGLDGFQTCRRLKQEKGLQHVPVIFMTGLSDTEHVLEGLQAGGVDYVAKPIVVEELEERIVLDVEDRARHVLEPSENVTGRRGVLATLQPSTELARREEQVHVVRPRVVLGHGDDSAVEAHLAMVVRRVLRHVTGQLGDLDLVLELALEARK